MSKHLQDKSNNKHTENLKSNNDNKSNNKSFFKPIGIIIILVALIELAYGGYMLYEKYRPKFKNTDIEIGTKEQIVMQDFLIDNKYEENSTLITDLSEINLSKVGEYNVKLSHDNREEEVTLRLVDTTAPEVNFQDVTKYIDYKINAEDFVKEKTDLSNMTVEVVDAPEITSFGDYDVKVVVKDEYGNEISNTCKLFIKWIKEEFAMEKGHTLTKEDLLYNAKEDGDLLDSNELKKITNSGIGEYEIKTKKNDMEVTTIVKITDLTPPTLTLKNVSVYDDEVSKITKNSFITTAKDASGEVTTNLKTKLNLSKIGTQEIVIEAIDKYGNVTEKTATLNIHKDNVGPVFSGLSTITISKGATIDYKKGVSAKDAKDGTCEFSVDSNAVNTTKAGTYYATYTSKDTKGNKTTKKRKIVVKHNNQDVQDLVNKIASGLSNNVEAIRDYCRNNIKYSHSYGDGDPVWYGFTNNSGNCYVHAYCFQALLKAKGYETQIIWVTNKTHYWNLVKINGQWKHMDSTPDRNHRKISIMNDKQRLSTLSGRDWDHSKWPACN